MTDSAASAAGRLAAALGLLLLCSMQTFAQPDDDFAITNVHVVPMDSERLLEDQVVLVIDGRIESIVSSAEASIPAGLRRIDGGGRYLMPGLSDLHTHILHPDDLVNYLAWGVTTVMHLGGSGLPGTELLDIREKVAQGQRPGPVIYTTNRVFDGVPALNSRSLSIATPDMARDEVRKLKAAGFDFVKIYNNVSRPVFDAITDEARLQGLAVIGHIPRGFPALQSLGGGQNAVAHTEEFFFTYFGGPRQTEDMPHDYVADLAKLPGLIDVLLENDVATMPDLSFAYTDHVMWDDLDTLWSDAEFEYLFPGTAAMWQAGTINRRSSIENFVLREEWKYDLMQTLTLAFQKAGILQVIGTDTALPGLFPGKAAHRELTELVKAGISRFDALAIGTRNGGEFVRKFIDPEARFGLVAEGYEATLVLLEENPLEDVRHARDVAAVSVRGRWIERAEIDRMRAQLRGRYATINDAKATAEAALLEDGAEAIIRSLIEASTEDPETLATIESTINSAGYSAAIAGDIDHSYDVLALNTRLFPRSANAWDSFAEITLHRGDRAAAISLYEKALEVDPGFENARRMIRELQEAQ